MAKNIHMIAPFDVLTGNLGSKQDLRYKEHDNKAYEAPDGVAGAKNYRTRYVGVRRADGKTYFMVKTRSTSNLNKKTRTTMAILGSIAAIKSALKLSADWSKLHAIYDYRKTHGWDEAGSDISFTKWIDYWLRKMLMYKTADLSLTSSGVSVKVDNPFNAPDEDGVAIGKSVFRKFGVTLSVPVVISFSVDGIAFFGAEAENWSFYNGASNPNYTNMFSDFDIPSGSPAGGVKYLNQPLYTSAGVAVMSDDEIVANESYTTIAPVTP